MSLATEMALDPARLLLNTADFAISISITPDGGSPATINCIADPIVDLIDEGVTRSTRIILISRDDVTDPAKATGTIEGRDFRVVDVQDGGPGAWMLDLDLGAVP